MIVQSLPSQPLSLPRDRTWARNPARSRHGRARSGTTERARGTSTRAAAPRRLCVKCAGWKIAPLPIDAPRESQVHPNPTPSSPYPMSMTPSWSSNWASTRQGGGPGRGIVAQVTHRSAKGRISIRVDESATRADSSATVREPDGDSGNFLIMPALSPPSWNGKQGHAKVAAPIQRVQAKRIEISGELSFRRRCVLIRPGA